jgi:hypothetical protein
MGGHPSSLLSDDVDLCEKDFRAKIVGDLLLVDGQGGGPAEGTPSNKLDDGKTIASQCSSNHMTYLNLPPAFISCSSSS